jgi:hypothetical protein
MNQLVNRNFSDCFSSIGRLCDHNSLEALQKDIKDSLTRPFSNSRSTRHPAGNFSCGSFEFISVVLHLCCPGQCTGDAWCGRALCVGSSKAMSASAKCGICSSTVYPVDPQINLNGSIYHKVCAKCVDCRCQVSTHHSQDLSSLTTWNRSLLRTSPRVEILCCAKLITQRGSTSKERN